MTNPVRAFVHDHDEMDRRVLMLSGLIRSNTSEAAPSTAEGLASSLVELRELLFLHFAREEEGLFPFVADIANDLEAQVHGMEITHDTICGALVRMVHLASIRAPLTIIASVFERFEASYADHARSEASLLKTLESRLDARQLARLRELVDGL